jgi:DNA-binding CsgD family transcriptional regulator
MPIVSDLSERELEILRLVATGASNKEIAQKLVISPNTVKVHMRNVFAKVGAASRTEAALFALREGLVENLAPQTLASEEQKPDGKDGEAQIPAPVLLAEPPPVALAEVEPVEAPLAGVPASRPDLEPAHFPLLRWLLASLLVVGVILLLVLGIPLLRGDPAATPLLASPTPGGLPVMAANQRWQEEASLPEARSGMAAVTYEDAIYVIGGITPSGVTGSLIRLRLGYKGWEARSGKPTPVSDIQAARLGERIYIPGGRLASGQPTDKLEYYELRQDYWAQAAPLPAARSGYALAAFEGQLYLFGGWDGSQYTDTVYSYDPVSNSWEVRSALPGRRGLAAAVVREGRIFLMGGTDGLQALSRLDAYTPLRDLPGENPWEARASLPQPRSGLAAVLMADQVYVVGGEGKSTGEGGLPPLQYQPFNDRWVALDESPVAVGAQPVALALETRLYVVGGRTPGGMSAFTQSYQAIYTINLPSVQK